MKSRVLTSVVAIPLVLAVVGCTNPWPLAVVLAVVFAVCVRELQLLFDTKSHVGPPAFALCAFGLAAQLLREQNSSGDLLAAIAGSAYFGLLLTCWMATRTKNTILQLGTFVPWSLLSLVWMLEIHKASATSRWEWIFPNPLLLLLLPVWAGDIAAMLGGMAFGKHPLAPKISPKKTWEGAISNFLAAILVGWGVGAWLGYQPWVGPACGAAVGVFGQFGDLFESALKRSVGKKDSGNLLPGHGGLLDRIDALLGSVIPVWLILYFSGSI